jgi:hypothetical protein
VKALTENDAKWWNKLITFRTGPIEWNLNWGVLGYVAMLGVFYAVDALK